MNLTIQTLNLWSAHILSFAWAAWWQSSLLIGLVWALDFALRRRVRAAVRYALWLIVLVKLLVPPSIALPTGLGWWLRPVPPAPAKPTTATPVVSYGANVALALPAEAAPAEASPPQTALSGAGWAVVASSGVSLMLLAWMLARWWQVARDVRYAEAAPAWLETVLEECRHTAGLRRRVRLRLIDMPVSPAVCGLLRPTILLPRLLSERLLPAQLRAVMLHELIHLRRGDVWVNCVQTLLQLMYWWHPLLWLANARIRRLREEVVDDAVVQALGAEAEAYAPTLLEVARLAFQRPLASLGLVGILESQNSLRQRILRLLEFSPPRKAGLTLGSTLCVLAFGALAVPMGPAPATPVGDPVSGSSPDLPRPDPRIKVHTVPNAPAGDAAQPSAALPQINITARFLEIPEDSKGSAAELWRSVGWAASDATNQARILTPTETAAVLQKTNSIPGCELVSRMSVTTLSGRQTEIEEVDFQSMLAGINPQALQPPGISTGSNDPAAFSAPPHQKSISATRTNGLFLVQDIGTGPTLDFVPIVVSNGWAVQLSTTATLTQFLGYDEPTNSVQVYENGKKVKVSPPLPRLQVSVVTNSATIGDGHTLVLGGLMSKSKNKLKDKIPILGDVPLIGGLFSRESSSVEKKHLLVLITPTLIDRVGNRIHDEERPPGTRSTGP